MVRIVVLGFALLMPCCKAATLYSIENWYHTKKVLQDLYYWRDWRIVQVDVSTGSVKSLSEWWNHCSTLLHPTGCGTNNYPLAVLYNGDYESNYQRTELLTAAGSIYDLVKHKYLEQHAFGQIAKMADMNDGFPYAASADDAIPNQVSVYTVDNIAPQPVCLGHVATIVMDSDRHKYGLWAPEVAIAAGCAIKMSGGCNVPSSFVYVSVSEYGSHGGLHVISRNNGTIAKIPVTGIEGYPSDMGSGFHGEALWVDLDVHPQTKVVLAGYHSGQSTTTFYEIDLSSGIASQKLQIAGLGHISRCTAYDNAARKWYVGCSTIATVSVDTWKVVSSQAVHHDNAEYSLSGLEILRDSPVLEVGRRDLVIV